MGNRIMYDSTTTDSIPEDAELVAYYPYSFPGPIDQFKSAQIVRIDNVGDHPELPVLDVESGAASVATAVTWLGDHEKEKGWPGTLYCNKNTLPALLKAIGGQKADLWIADPTGELHVWEPDTPLPPNVALVATQCLWPGLGSDGHYDVSVVNADSWFAEPVPAPAPEPTVISKGVLVTSDLTTKNLETSDGRVWTESS